MIDSFDRIDDRRLQSGRWTDATTEFRRMAAILLRDVSLTNKNPQNDGDTLPMVICLDAGGRSIIVDRSANKYKVEFDINIHARRQRERDIDRCGQQQQQ